MRVGEKSGSMPDTREGTGRESEGVSCLIKSMQVLWNQVFGDEWTYLEDFFSTFFPNPALEQDSLLSGDNRVLYVREGNRVISQLFMISYGLEGRREKAVYLYALATHPAYRGQGLMDALIHRCLNLVEEGAAEGAFLIPAQESLQGYYEKYGFHTAGSFPAGQDGGPLWEPGSYSSIALTGSQRDFFLRTLRREGLGEEDWRAPGIPPMLWGNRMPCQLGMYGILT